MEHGNVNFKEPIKLFGHPLLEGLTKSSPAITVIFYSLVIGTFIYLNLYFTDLSFKASVLTYIGGFFFWTLFEYLMHRFIFHMISDIPWTKKMAYLLHGVHHENPHDKNRLFMPPVPGLIIISIQFIICIVTIKSYTYIFLAGLLNGYLLYAMMHYAMHAFRPPNKFCQKLWLYHSQHHFKNPDKGFGVSSPLWDVIFGTLPPNEK